MLAMQQPSIATAATDNIYTLTEVTPAPTWEGTNGNRLQASSTYGDERIVTFNLPWDFIFYGQTYTVGTPVTLDTNGNIWFASNLTTSAHNFALDTTAGRGPVIAAWNDDLSSAYFGGVYVQHKTDLPLGERVVVEWQAETQADEGLFVSNSFETILFQDGRVRIDYQSIKTTQGADAGSGISRGANGIFLDVTSNFGQVPVLASSSRRSFMYAPIPATVNVVFSGTGSGSVTILPSGVSCNSNCSSDFYASQQITLQPTPELYSYFAGWSYDSCTGVGNCIFSITGNPTVTATFNLEASTRSGEFYPSVQIAYDNAITGDTIYAWDYQFSDGLICDQDREVTILGGYDPIYSSVVGTSRLSNPLIIKAGTVRVKNLTIVGGASAAPMMMTTTLAATDSASALAVTSTPGPALIERNTTGCETDCDDEEDEDHDNDNNHHKRHHKRQLRDRHGDH